MAGAMKEVAAALASALATRVDAAPERAVHGGCISESVRWRSDRGALFVKLGAPANAAAFAAEAAGLQELASAQAVRVPRPLAHGCTQARAWLALEWVDLARPAAATQARLGEQLALQHRACAAQFGWSRDNTIGSTPQHNALTGDWVAFFRDRRLRAQLDLARDNGHAAALTERGEQLLQLLPAFFAGHRPVPSLLHGDLWGGNFAADAHGAPVIFDPAVYYGDRETDLAMTRLFGGFGREFDAAYRSAWPLAPEAQVRCELYNLYHVLNHLNLFGGGYAAQARGMIDRLLAHLGH